MTGSLDSVTRAVTELRLEEITAELERALDDGASAHDLLDAMRAGMVQVGELFQDGEYYLADLVLAGEVMKEGLKVIEPRLARGSGCEGTVVIATVKGDIHDIGKNLVSNMLSSSGFQVVDLGVDVPPERVVEAVRSTKAGAVGLSVLLTPMVDAIADTVAALRAAGLRRSVKIAIGGACTSADLARRMEVDAVGEDPVDAVRIFRSFLDLS
jgi:5-methyltetrahydrofolate--homocysteine methyltransferase